MDKRAKQEAKERRERMAWAEEAIRTILGTGPVDEMQATDGEITEFTQRLSDLEGAIRWVLGDILAGHKARVGAMRAYRAGAAGLGKSTRWAIELTRISEIYPGQYRLAGVDWHAYRVASSKEKPYDEITQQIETSLEAA